TLRAGSPNPEMPAGLGPGRASECLSTGRSGISGRRISVDDSRTTNSTLVSWCLIALRMRVYDPGGRAKRNEFESLSGTQIATSAPGSRSQIAKKRGVVRREGLFHRERLRRCERVPLCVTWERCRQPRRTSAPNRFDYPHQEK